MFALSDNPKRVNVDPFCQEICNANRFELKVVFANVLLGSCEDKVGEEGGSLNLVLEPRQSGPRFSKRGIMAHKDQRGQSHKIHPKLKDLSSMF